MLCGERILCYTVSGMCFHVDHVREPKSIKPELQRAWRESEKESEKNKFLACHMPHLQEKQGI